MKVSLIIPILNEGKQLSRLLPRLKRVERLGHEVIVVDGGSSDQSLALLDAAKLRYIVAETGRASQMNRAAESASGSVYWFMHADTQFEPQLINSLVQINNVENQWGWFRVGLSGQSLWFRLIEKMMHWRSAMTSIATGDQCLFVGAQLFARVGGYPQQPLMEDIELSRQLKTITRPVRQLQRVISSSRRWEKNGIIRTVLLMWGLRLGYFFGVKPEVLAKWYSQ